MGVNAQLRKRALAHLAHIFSVGRDRRGGGRASQCRRIFRRAKTHFVTPRSCASSRVSKRRHGTYEMVIAAGIMAIWAPGLLSLALTLPPEFFSPPKPDSATTKERDIRRCAHMCLADE